MNNNWKNIHNLIEYSEGGILSKVLVKTEKSDVTLFCMGAGTQITEHTSTREAFVYCVEGKGIFHLEGEDITLEPGVFIQMKKDAVHRISANKNLAFLLILI